MCVWKRRIPWGNVLVSNEVPEHEWATLVWADPASSCQTRKRDEIRQRNVKWIRTPSVIILKHSQRCSNQLQNTRMYLCLDFVKSEVVKVCVPLQWFVRLWINKTLKDGCKIKASWSLKTSQLPHSLCLCKNDNWSWIGFDSFPDWFQVLQKLRL